MSREWDRCSKGEDESEGEYACQVEQVRTGVASWDMVGVCWWLGEGDGAKGA